MGAAAAGAAGARLAGALPQLLQAGAASQPQLLWKRPRKPLVWQPLSQTGTLTHTLRQTL